MLLRPIVSMTLRDIGCMIERYRTEKEDDSRREEVNLLRVL